MGFPIWERQRTAGRPRWRKETPRLEVNSEETWRNLNRPLEKIRQTMRRLPPRPVVQKRKDRQSYHGRRRILVRSMKEFVKEIEAMHGLASGRLVDEIEARLMGIVEPSVEQMREAIKKEIRAIEEEFLENISSPKDQERKERRKNKHLCRTDKKR